MHVLKPSLLAFSLSLIAACGPNPSQKSDLNITNGRIVLDSDYPEVVNLYRRVYQNGKVKGGATCTGTWVAENTILTAAHCTGDGPSDANGLVENVEIVVFEITDHTTKPKATKGITRVVAAYRNKLWEKDKSFNRYDLAILKTQEIQANERPRGAIAISSVPAKLKDSVEIIGFGFNNMSNFGKSGDDLKRVGRNVIDSVSDGFYGLTGEVKDVASGATGEGSSAGQGDSGGPMLLNGQLVGVASGGGVGGIFARGQASYVNLSSPESQAFLKSFGL